jgi:dTDP-4-dehydrorhamnose reductase
MAEILITGADGQLGRAAQEAFSVAGWQVTTTDIEQLDIRDRGAVLDAVTTLSPDAVLNAGALTDPDLCELHPEQATATNATAVGHLAEACRRSGALLCHISSDYVFDGTADRPYTEGDEPRPLSVYGRSKLDGERAAGADALVVRTAWVSGRAGRNIVRTVLDQARDPDRVLRFVDDQRGSPTAADDLALALVDLVAQRWTGVFHVTNQGEATWYDLARRVLVEAGHDPERVRPITTEALDPPRLAPRPAFSVLDNAMLRLSGVPLLPHWTAAIADLVRRLPHLA